ncbi:MAG: hypothetical protein R3B41_03770 [Candidatus Doudnabacteria bacterium]
MNLLKSIFYSPFFVAIAIMAIVGLAVAQFREPVPSAPSFSKVLAETSTQSSNMFTDLNLENAIDPSLAPHVFCGYRLYFLEDPSDTYVSNVPYNVDFLRMNPGGGVLQDINGDSLPDYVYTSHDTTTSGGTSITSHYSGCVFLNNGSGWDKVYECFAKTLSNMSTGEITLAEYRGDCAGASSAKSEKSEASVDSTSTSDTKTEDTSNPEVIKE